MNTILRTAVFVVLATATIMVVWASIYIHTHERPATFNERFGVWSLSHKGHLYHQWDPARRFA